LAGQSGEPGLTLLPGCAREHPAVDVEASRVPSSGTGERLKRLVVARCRPALLRTGRCRRAGAGAGWKPTLAVGVPLCTAGGGHGRRTRRTHRPCEPRATGACALASPRLTGCRAGRAGSQERPPETHHAVMRSSNAVRPSHQDAERTHTAKHAGRRGEVAQRRDRRSDLIPIRMHRAGLHTKVKRPAFSAGQRPFRGPGRT
jgi:hypothetical protein